MGTRIDLIFPHRLSDWEDQDCVLQVLSKSLPEALILANYWEEPDRETEWKAMPRAPHPEGDTYRRYTGPGPLFVDVNPYAIRVRSGGRWRGFLSIQPLRSAHVQAFYSIMNAFDATIAHCYPDDDFVAAAYWEGSDFPDCCHVLKEQFGDPIPIQEEIDPEIAAKTKHGCPILQYVLTMP